VALLERQPEHVLRGAGKCAPSRRQARIDGGKLFSGSQRGRNIEPIAIKEYIFISCPIVPSAARRVNASL
jgi:hypothetical protein